MSDLYKIEGIVIEILMADSNARNSDDYLYFKVCQRLDNAVLDVKLGDWLLGFNKYDMPRFASVSRARRKVQAQFPELRATEKINKCRYERAVMFEEYAVR